MIIPSLEFEEKLWRQGYRYVVGIDEVGRGAWAGPVVVGAVIFESSCDIPEGIRDSKLLAPSIREKISEKIMQIATAVSFGVIPVKIINKIGIAEATQMAMRAAVKNLIPKPDFHLIDAFYIKHLKRQDQLPIIKGDQKCVSIAAASVVAKVFRDKLMTNLDIKFPGYLFSKNKGYGTRIHRECIRKLGFSRIHRSSFDLGWLLDE